ncbi:hypothetical protein [Clostridium frigidicarnis]|uniref:Uncharacterized protein n=1 Tax=Clostridium frigidicarnis TaxID=84698 RepID=A0A1I0V673_9CLOT|nr:hypothetical protein [Clostridium frigidicarnis]SFA71778.1 hypothetical protein SAMN04488528_1001182 [Clostridium frigidicarnis]
MGNLTKSEVMTKIEKYNYKFAWINTFSSLKLIELSEDKFQEIWLDNLIEAKCFDEDKELSIMGEDNDENFSVVEFDGKGKEYVEEDQILNKNKSPFKNRGEDDKLVIRNYLKYDNEGQVSIYYSKLSNVERGETID